MKLPLELFKFSILKTFTKVIFVTLCTPLFNQLALAQTEENFSDGEFLSSPAWTGTSTAFIVNTSGQLQLNASVAGTAYLSTAFDRPDILNSEWRIYIKHSFSPSGSNYGRFYLTSDQSDLSLPLNGYYLQFGEAGSNDAVELFRQSGTTSVSVCRAANGAIASSFAIRVQVLRDTSGMWQLGIDYSGGQNFITEASGFDTTYASSSFLGVKCMYTISNARNFYYDDIYAGEKIVDKTPPVIQQIQVLSSRELDIRFDEIMDSSSAEVTTNYTASHGIATPISAVLQGDLKTVRLSFAVDFPNGRECSLQISGLKDIAGNLMVTTEKAFLFFQPVKAAFKDIVITEILADPSPTLGLPEAEYIEIYNRGESPFDLNGWKLTDGSSIATLSSFILLPDSYLILTTTSTADDFIAFGEVAAVSNFPTLNNSGDPVVLKNEEGQTIDSLLYSDLWYVDQDKKSGGWSLELIDPENICGEQNNWSASEDESGGTPGRQNSIFANKPDLTGPRLLSVIPLSDNVLKLTFDEKLDRNLPALTSFELEPATPLVGVSFYDGSLTAIQLVLTADLLTGQKYTIAVQSIFDCAGNIIQVDFSRFDFGLPEVAETGDVVINELLFNPRPTGVDFVELYNTSEKYFNIKDWKVGNYEDGLFKNGALISAQDFLLKPHAYVVLTEDGNIVKGEYIQAVEENFWETNLPSFPDDEGSVAIVDNTVKMLDYIQYSDKMHSPFIKNEEGVSLERVSVKMSSSDLQNWKSASSVSGFATPGYVNANTLPENSLPENAIRLEPEIFEPVTGQPDYTQIQYSFDQGGFVANVKVLDPQGRVLKKIANNEVLGTIGFFRWEGDRDDGTKVRVGYYMIWFEVFDANGLLKTFRKRVAVASRF